MECPHCHKEFKPANYMCDNDCYTEYCSKCDGEVHIEKGELVKGHDPSCGELSF